MNHPFQTQSTATNLRKRAELLGRLRCFFDERGFTEVQTPVLCSETVIDRHLDPIAVPLILPGQTSALWYLQTSPEQSMKRLLASGIGSIYQVGPVFRDGELGRLHNPEFTMAEWYDVGADYERGQQLLSDLLVCLLHCEPAECVSFEQAFKTAIGLPLFESSPADFGRWAVENEIVDTEKWSSDWDDWVNLLFSERVQGMLGWHRPTIVKDFPASQAALAVVSDRDPRTAERYEIFYHGVELANGYHELLDANVLADRDRIANEQRVLDGKTALPTCNKLLEAMRNGIPASCGCALGFDRVVMLACNATNLREVVSFAAERA